jgi:hypothetical protein
MFMGFAPISPSSLENLALPDPHQMTLGNYRRIPVLLFALINFLFIYKYATRITPWGLEIATVYLLLSVFVIHFLWQLPERRFTRRLFYIYFGLFLGAAIILVNRIRPEDLNVDRWSIIESFLQALFNGQYPYSAESIHNNHPAPFPMYFIFAIPFYLIGQIGYIPLVGYLAFAYLLKLRGYSLRTRTILVILLSTSPIFLWEVITKSTLFTNVLLVMFYLHWLESTPLKKLPKQLLAGGVGGILLSTRAVLAIPIGCYFVYKYHRRKMWKTGLFIGATLLIVFSLTLFPFWIWDPVLFSQYNPITLQGSFLPWYLSAGIGLVAIFYAMKVKNIVQLDSLLMEILTTIVAAAFLTTIVQHGFTSAFFQSRFDISYFQFAIPFALTAMPGERDNN